MTSIFALAGTFLSLARLDRDGCAARGSPNADRRARDARDDRDARATSFGGANVQGFEASDSMVRAPRDEV